MLIAVGDYWNGDAAVSHRVLSLLGAPSGVAMLDSIHWSSDLAPRIARADEVIFVQADERIGIPYMTPLDGRTPAGQIVAHARQKFRFRGHAYLCRVPGLEFGRRAGNGLTAYAESRARQAAGLLRKFLGVKA